MIRPGLNEHQLALRENKGEFVLAPGGFRHRSKVLQVTARRITHKTGKTHFTKKTKLSVLEFNIVPAVEDNFNPNWVAFAHVTIDRPIFTSFSARWTVPQAPETDNGQTIFIFIGLQNSNKILQPVLQWGESAAGGGSFWSVASWYAGDTSDEFKFVPAIRVESGTLLNAFIIANSLRGSVGSYTCGFENLDETHLPSITNVSALNDFCIVLESYNISASSDYPNMEKTSISDIALRKSQQALSLNWKTKLGTHPPSVSVLHEGYISEMEFAY